MKEGRRKEGRKEGTPRYAHHEGRKAEEGRKEGRKEGKRRKEGR